MNPKQLSVLSNKYNLEFSVFLLEKNCIIKYDFNYFNNFYLMNTDTQENSTYCIIHSGNNAISMTLFKDPKTSPLNTFSYYNSFSMEGKPIEIKDETTTITDKKFIIIKYTIGLGNPYGFVGISRTTPKYMSGRFFYSDIVNRPITFENETKIDSKIDEKIVHETIINAKFGRNSVQISKDTETTVVTPNIPGKNTFVAFLNYNHFKFSDINKPNEVLRSTESFKVIAKDEDRNLDFVFFALDTKDSSLDFIINQNRKQYLIDTGIKYLPESHLIVFIGSEDYNVTTYISKKIANNKNYKIQIHSSYTMNDEPETIMNSKALYDVNFVIFRVIVQEVCENSFIGIALIAKQIDRIRPVVSGNFFVPSILHIFTKETSYYDKVVLRPENYHSKVPILDEINPIKVGPNSLITFETALVEDYFIIAEADGIKINVTDLKMQALITKKETELSLNVTNKQSIIKVPINIFKLDYLKGKCNEMIVSGGSQDISICNNYSTSDRKCTHIITKENKTCIFKPFNSKYTSSDIIVSNISDVEIFTPDGIPIKSSLEDTILSISSSFVFVINPPEDIDEREFYFSATMKNGNSEIESPYLLGNDEIYQFEAKTKSGAIAGWTIFSLIVISCIVAGLVLLYKKYYDPRVRSDSESESSSRSPNPLNNGNNVSESSDSWKY
ncbi:hypothetical protein TVAG_080710 [Trichomonas vaginalis G3]|uniref:Uncharacterized protein n=1 Tax=Trichomonas vaginalis (strain ATCC PRA-98 / G3) TaxID=412133 RepID=A2G9K8_TRIV3|nr:hypothetical protein TVAGG3_0877490 [Trichomonas vaginalis G3]EAX86159.1 hypothetical protein TVAG_080710 [Trichomonas vaginalis G3]KAI5501798.1 hypothetical protein TVAGG3_0877490 [Trichomonas vaginalis G3]|eukprot:XP_001299089.1 hypothetical protein [Trichomonas vaginalis G3]